MAQAQSSQPGKNGQIKFYEFINGLELPRKRVQRKRERGSAAELMRIIGGRAYVEKWVDRSIDSARNCKWKREREKHLPV
jgi:hypothetical protein